MTGIEFQPYFHPNWSSYIPLAMQNVQALGSNWVMVTPTWTYSSANPLIFRHASRCRPIVDRYRQHDLAGTRTQSECGHFPATALPCINLGHFDFAQCKFLEERAA